MGSDQGAKRLIILGNFEDLSLIKTTRSLRLHPCPSASETTNLGSSARTVYLVSALTLVRKLRARDRSKERGQTPALLSGATRYFF